MNWFGKVVGGAFGFFLGGPLGALLGAALGHRLDLEQSDTGLLEADLSPAARQRMQMAFFTATFSVMGHLAKADGRITEAEIEAARSIMNRLELPEDWRKTAIKLFNEGKRPGFPLDATLEQFRAECQQRHSLLRMFIEFQLEAALADGALQESEEALLVHLCERVRFSRFEFRAMRLRMEADRRFARQNGRQQQGIRRESRELSTTEAYALLGIAPSASERDIKRAYRRLMSRHHPDKLLAQGLSEDAVRRANEKTQRIRKAYEVITKVRKL